jgi:citrate lyase beta subunit
MPGSNERALEKAKTIPADALIFDPAWRPSSGAAALNYSTLRLD